MGTTGIGIHGYTITLVNYESQLRVEDESIAQSRLALCALIAGCKGEIAFKSACISELRVAEIHRGKGVGSSLLAEAEYLAQDKGRHRIYLETRNEGARRLYERTGYHVIGTFANYVGTQSFYYLEKSLLQQFFMHLQVITRESPLHT